MGNIDWPTAGVIITALVSFTTPLVAAIIRWVPKRLTNGKGEYYARAADLIEMRARIPQIEKTLLDESKYTHDSVHRLNNVWQSLATDQAVLKNAIANIERDVQELLERTRWMHKD